jgi:2-polyprenyl-6-hydroxyphenyl methylase/3-demethylubiquinone-9 3-methyltransferase
MKDALAEISAGERFAFGENWSQFLTLVDDERVRQAVASIKTTLAVADLAGQRFLDVGSGSVLFSLAARRLGATVVSFDYDPTSVACTAELRRRYDVSANDVTWQVLQGSALDHDFLRSLGQFDIVYSWGGLHHTGDIWAALGNVATMVGPGGRLFVSIYNDQGRASRNWRRVKQMYNGSGQLVRRSLVAGSKLHFALQSVDLPGTVYRVVRRLPPPAKGQARDRGMDKDRDLVDWVGGWPFEVARPEDVFDFCRERGFQLEKLKTCGGGIGCNEYVFGLPSEETRA